MLLISLARFSVVFFFKQKTSYEMRISDWSSDVCSSDLPDGYTLVGRTCTKTLTQPADVTYTCPDGGVLQGTTCVVTQPASVSSHSCPAGFTLQGTNCTRTTTEPAVITGYSCPADYMLEGDRCVRTLEQSATPNYNCHPGYVLEGKT